MIYNFVINYSRANESQLQYLMSAAILISEKPDRTIWTTINNLTYLEIETEIYYLIILTIYVNYL